MIRRAIITSISGKILTSREKKLIVETKPWGVILFKRNIESFHQTKKLITNIRKAIKDKKYPILIDEEGGNVCRLSNLIDNKIYSQKFFGDLYKVNKSLAVSLYKHYIFSLSNILKSLGININTVPVLDIFKKKTNKIIGSRSYSFDKETIKYLGFLCVDTYKKNKIGTVIKHLPGHGSAQSDSHKRLPFVKDSYSSLEKNDFNSFYKMNSYFAMTAHILYKYLDTKNVSTHSKFIIQNIIRKKIGFKGILLSDDISMKALKYDLLNNALKSLDAGCNLVLYCAGNYEDSENLLNKIPLIDSFTAKKTSEFYKFLS